MLIYDIEIAHAIPGRDGLREEGITYAAGWSDFAGMGIACIGVYDFRTDRPRIFCRDNLDEFTALLTKQECIVGYNNLRFDNKVLEAAGLSAIPPEKCYDLLVEIWRGVGLGSDFRPETHGGFSLDAMCWANFKAAKTGPGALAPINFQRGKLGSVIDYCLADVYLTKRLLDRVIRSGQLVNPKTGDLISVRKPGGQR